MSLYGKVEYWDERYRATSALPPYDWYQTYGTLRHLLTVEALMATTKLDSITTLPPHDKCRVLILGCGNSTFAGDMILDGWKGKITNIDFSSVVIEQMKARFHHDDDNNNTFCEKFHCPPMEFVCADITQGLPFDDHSFDLIICKGTFDAILCSSGSVANIKRVVSECSRVLCNGHGVFFMVSYGNPDSRVVFLEHDNDLSYYWQEVSIHSVPRVSPSGGTKNDYVYICRKRIKDPVPNNNNINRKKAPPTNDENAEKKQPSLPSASTATAATAAPDTVKK